MTNANLALDPLLASSEDPYSVYRQMREECPVLRVSDDLLVVSRYDDIETILSDQHRYSSQYGHGMIDSDPPRHTLLRRAARGAFTPKRIRALHSLVDSINRPLLRSLHERQDVDLVRDYTRPLSLAMTAEMIGIPVADREQLMEWYFAAEYEGQQDGRAKTLSRLLALAADRRVNPSDDLISELVDPEADEPLADADVAALCAELFEASLDNPAAGLGNALLALSEHPDQRSVLCACASDPTRLTAAVNELVRYDSPVQRIPRRVSVESTLQDEVALPGSEVQTLVGSALRDALRFEEPERLDLSRPPTRSLAFGHGIHFCLGAPLTRLVMMVSLPSFLAAFPAYAIEGVDREPSGYMRVPRSLPATLSPG